MRLSTGSYAKVISIKKSDYEEIQKIIENRMNNLVHVLVEMIAKHSEKKD